jgi:hypothetical protein
VIAGNARLGTLYAWTPAEIAADDCRLLFGADNAISQRPKHMNHRYIQDLREVKA